MDLSRLIIPVPNPRNADRIPYALGCEFRGGFWDDGGETLVFPDGRRVSGWSGKNGHKFRVLPVLDAEWPRGPMGAYIVPLDNITSRNSRINPEHAAKINDSIARDGVMHPPILSRDMEVINGMNRVRAARAFGWKSIPAYVCDVSLHEARDLT